jgi:Legume lectin domain/Chitobiase/beta-hexosaminidase C-terminal domain
MSGVRKVFRFIANQREAHSLPASKIGASARSFIACLAIAASCTVFAHAQVNVTTYQNDIGRTGQNLNETILNTTNVNTTQFGKLFSQPVDGQVYTQPLYLSGIVVNGVTHNVIFVATENDSVYAFDADSNGGINAGPLWMASMLSTTHGAAPGATTIPSNDVSTDISPQVGITGTPVIDPATGTLYVVSAALENGNAVQRLHALDVTSGAEKFGGPVVVTATVPGTGNGSTNGTLTFDSLWENQRPGLLLLNGIVWIGFASHGDNGPWHGWILGYNASTLAQTGVFCATPNGTGAGFWMSGQGLAADQLDPVNHPFGRMFVPTGNGDYTATKPYTNNMDYGDSHLNLDLTNGVPTVTDEFTTNQQAMLNSQDGDIAAGGMLVVPTQTTGNYPHLAVQAGKGGTLYLLNRDNLGGYNTTTDQAIQEQTYAVGNVGVWSSPAYWNGNVYYWGRFDNLKSFPLVNGLLSTNPTKSSESYGYPGATPAISANGSTQGIVWSIDSEAYTSNGPAVLQAHNASNVGTMLYSSSANSARDTAGGAVKFTVPTVVNGKVYVPAAAEVDFYGLLNGITQTSAPSISPGSESYSGTLSATITDTTPGAAIYYTTNGTPATTSSTLYTGPITVSSSTTINAIASATNSLLSAQATAVYTNVSQATVVIFSLPTGNYSSAQTVTLSDSTVNATIYYTLDGTTPTTSSTLYTGPITVGSTETITAIAAAPGVSNSAPLAQTYTIVLGQTGISFPQGFAASAGLVNLNGSAQLNDSRLQLTDGGVAEAGSGWYYQPVNVQSFTTDFTFQLSNPVANGITFSIQNAPQLFWALGGNGSGLGYQFMSPSVGIKFDFFTPVGTGTDSTGLYTNGAVPTTPAIDLSTTGINLASDDAMAVHMTYNGTTLTMTITDMVTAAVWSNSWTVNIPSIVGANTAYVGFTGSTGASTASQKILTWSYETVSATAAATPTFTPPAGSYSGTQTVAISDLTPAATIYYTTNGSTPTTASTVYSGPVTVSSSETLKAIATATGYTASATGTAAYTIGGTTATPTFAPAAGSYTSAQTVTISDATSGASIYYTTNGTTPTTGSTVYSGPITVSATETLNAIAVVSGVSSSTGTAAYTISTVAATPGFSPLGGTYTSAQTVTISDTTTGATIYYTTNGKTPTTSSTKYSAPITVSASETLQAIAVATGFSNSSVGSAAYTINLPAAATPTFTPAAGTYTGAQTVTISDTTTGATIYYTTNGTAPTTSSTVYAVPVTVSASETLKAIAVATGFSNSSVGSAAYTISKTAATPTFSPAAGTYTSAQTVTISDTTTGATIYYTTNGTTPTTASTGYSAPITVSASETLKAIAVAAGYTNSATGSAAYTITTAAATPTFSLAPGTYSSAQTVTISDTTTGATIYFTTNGKTPTTSSNKYTGSISINASQTIQAIAVATGYSTSAVASATYTLAAAAPTITPAGGTYTGPVTVIMSTISPGVAIYYTTAGNLPTTSSPKYTGPITVSSSEIVRAMAAQTGFTTSATVSNTYTITAVTATPTFSPVAGSYTNAQTVTISDATAGATIYYTTNGTTPTTSSSVYSSPITVGATETVNAIAVTSASTSPTGSAAYTITTATPTFLPAAGTYAGTQTVTISDATTGATIYYTTNGTAPTTSSTVYSGPITVSATEALNAIAVTSNATSSTGSAAYTITAAPPTINFPSSFTGTGLVLNSATITGGALQLTDGGPGEARTAWYAKPVNIQSFVTDFNFQQTSASADGFTFAIQNSSKGIYGLGNNGGGLGYQGIGASIAVKFDLYNDTTGGPGDSTGFYTNGASPATPFVDMTNSGINLHSGDIIHAHITYDGTTLTLIITDTVTNATFTTSTAINIPTTVGANTAYVGFTGGTGALTAIQNILNWTYTVN